MDNRKCKKCNEIKDIKDFGKHIRLKDGIDNYCKICKRKMCKDWHINNLHKSKSTKSLSDKKWYIKNKDKKIKNNIKWKTLNKEYNKEWFREYKKEREARDPQFRMLNKIRTRIWYALKKNDKNNNNGTTAELLGCQSDFLKKYLESKFTEGMSWDNYGKWHIDHIVPLSSFDLSDPVQLEKACHYTNLQPLWAKDNLKKSNKIITY